MKRRLGFLGLLALLLTPGLVHAQALQIPNGANVTGNLTVSGTTTATGGVSNGCNWSVVVYGGVAAQTSNVACLANYSHVVAVPNNQGGTPTAVITPALPAITPQVAVNCAITAPGSTTVACIAPAGQATITVYGYAW